jgi:hypothetical protein
MNADEAKNATWCLDEDLTCLRCATIIAIGTECPHVAYSQDKSIFDKEANVRIVVKGEIRDGPIHVQITEVAADYTTYVIGMPKKEEVSKALVDISTRLSTATDKLACIEYGRGIDSGLFGPVTEEELPDVHCP